MRIGLVPLIFAGLSLVGCASDKFTGRTDLTTVKSADLPRPSRPAETPTTTYLIGPSDRLAIDAVGVLAAPREVTVDPSGQISVPFAGTIRAAGLTPTQLTAIISTRMRQNYVRAPQVSVNVTEVLSQTVTVDGQVTTPGVYAFSGPFTLLRAIARAQGTTEFANTGYVVVYRTVDGQKYAGLYDLRAIRAGTYPDPDVIANDVIVVDESRARRIFKDVLASSGLITTPLVIAFR